MGILSMKCVNKKKCGNNMASHQFPLSLLTTSTRFSGGQPAEVFKNTIEEILKKEAEQKA